VAGFAAGGSDVGADVGGIMSEKQRDFFSKLEKNSEGRIVYTYRGGVERGPRYEWRDGYSATHDGHVIYPWMTKRECQQEAKAHGQRAAFRHSPEETS
jgi:hypothetical protein